MRQTALIYYLHVTARLQLINCFKCRTSHELNFNTKFQLPSFLPAVKCNFNILVNSQMQCSNAIYSNTSTLINFDAVYQGDSKFVRKPGKPKLRLSAQSSLTSETRHFGDAQFILLRILSSSKYIKFNYLFGSAHVKIGV